MGLKNRPQRWGTVLKNLKNYPLKLGNGFEKSHMGSYETLIDRARREAILRMKEQARSADAIVNFRIETSSISKGGRRRGKTVGTVEALAYGTAIRIKKD
jgi:uncharacterized protein YbjQ (UPF0145 family)